ncbi:predicted protein [Micromonas commoda]|uniref:Uncharacterized protein n=1 Tax=Micromonas commoda (strain RCC299 / NOUM17 / CCMP2709) TaxID=296587 RepID=C1E4W8_MICCC|nr:predicted protein [Micromonas commoda]ACO63194.1 predicted protein [Micromonas commoda]|eukprot:XP_002501936.1 predicted protein [Micromonas commoda]
MPLATASAAVAPARARPVASQRAGAGADRRARLIRRPARSPVPTRATSPAAADPAANADGMYDGTVFFHLYPELKSPKPIFSTFLEGALHCCEVARSHPDYCSAHFHEAIDQDDAIDCKPHGYFNMTLFKCPPAELFERFEDLHECLDIGHMDQIHHPLPCQEVAAIPGPTSAIARVPHGVVRYSERDAVVMVATPRGNNGLDARDWRAWSGADVAAEKAAETFLGASLHRCVDDAAAFEHVVRIELGACDAGAVDACVARARSECGDGAVVGGFRCAFNIEKTGTPAGAMPAVREMQKKKKEAEAAGGVSVADAGKKTGQV